MEPLSSLALAAAVIQFFDFSMKTLAVCRRLRDSNGRLPELLELDQKMRTLETLATQLSGQGPLSQHTNQSAKVSSNDIALLCRQLDLNEKKIRELGRKCAATAQELLQLLQQLRGSTQSGAQVLKQALRLMRQQRKIEKLEASIQKHDEQLQLLIVLDSRSRLQLQRLEQAVHSSELHTQLSIILDRVGRESQQISEENKEASHEIQNAVHGAASSVKHTLEHNLKGLTLQAGRQRKRDTLLKSLHFPEYSMRRESLEPAWEKTYKWLFKDSKDRDPKIPSFSKWLRQDATIYYICGKAGCGKSTLMSYLVDHNLTREGLSEWGGIRPVTRASHFFWSTGSALQKSITGLLRTLLYQLCSKSEGLSDFVTTQIDMTGDLLDAWTIEKLTRCLKSVFAATSDLFCIFVDGLDEFHGDSSNLVDLIQEVAMLENVKCVVSSRPEPRFLARFRDCAHIRMEHLTRRDIECFVSQKLSKSFATADRGHKLRKWTREISSRAEGIFMWAKLVTDSIIYGLESGDDEAILRQRLHGLPRELGGLYKTMLEGIDPLHKESVAFLLQVLMTYKRIGVSVIIANIAAALCPEKVEHLPSFLEECRNIKKQILSRSRGLLTATDGNMWARMEPSNLTVEVTGAAVWWASADERLDNVNIWRRFGADVKTSIMNVVSFYQYNATYLDITHRSVAEFLTESDAGKSFMAHCSLSSADIALATLRGTICLTQLTPSFKQPLISLREADIIGVLARETAPEHRMQVDELLTSFLGWSLSLSKENIVAFSEEPLKDKEPCSAARLIQGLLGEGVVQPIIRQMQVIKTHPHSPSLLASGILGVSHAVRENDVQFSQECGFTDVMMRLFTTLWTHLRASNPRSASEGNRRDGVCVLDVYTTCNISHHNFPPGSDPDLDVVALLADSFDQIIWFRQQACNKITQILANILQIELCKAMNYLNVFMDITLDKNPVNDFFHLNIQIPASKMFEEHLAVADLKHEPAMRICYYETVDDSSSFDWTGSSFCDVKGEKLAFEGTVIIHDLDDVSVMGTWRYRIPCVGGRDKELLLLQKYAFSSWHVGSFIECRAALVASILQDEGLKLRSKVVLAAQAFMRLRDYWHIVQVDGSLSDNIIELNRKICSRGYYRSDYNVWLDDNREYLDYMAQFVQADAPKELRIELESNHVA